MKIKAPPDQTNIKGWKRGVDGYSVYVEFSNPEKYSMKSYWSPDFYKDLPEAISVANFEKFLESTLSSREKWSSFIDGLPKGCYNTGGIVLICNYNKKPRKLLLK